MTATAGKRNRIHFRSDSLRINHSHATKKKASSKAAFNKTAIKGVEYSFKWGPWGLIFSRHSWIFFARVYSGINLTHRCYRLKSNIKCTVIQWNRSDQTSSKLLILMCKCWQLLYGVVREFVFHANLAGISCWAIPDSDVLDCSSHQVFHDMHSVSSGMLMSYK